MHLDELATNSGIDGNLTSESFELFIGHDAGTRQERIRDGEGGKGKGIREELRMRNKNGIEVLVKRQMRKHCMEGSKGRKCGDEIERRRSGEGEEEEEEGAGEKKMKKVQVSKVRIDEGEEHAMECGCV